MRKQSSGLSSLAAAGLPLSFGAASASSSGFSHQSKGARRKFRDATAQLIVLTASLSCNPCLYEPCWDRRIRRYRPECQTQPEPAPKASLPHDQWASAIGGIVQSIRTWHGKLRAAGDARRLSAFTTISNRRSSDIG